MLPFAAVISLGLLRSQLAFAAPTSLQPTVKTPDGTTWLGKTSPYGIEEFLGMPYAQPPVGNLRFAPPLAPVRSFGRFNASSYGASCPQLSASSGISPDFLNGVPQEVLGLIVSSPIFTDLNNTSEDCLSINVQRPPGTSSSSKLPIMFWIYGGAFSFGSSASYDGTALIARSVTMGTPVIFVSINHRLNAFGFLPGQEVANDPTASVNAGLQDQRLALEWLQTNAAAFGGDPRKVTVFGQSSGAISIALLMQAYDGDIRSATTKRPLFRAAIMQSGAGIPLLPESGGQQSFDIIANAVGCKRIADPIACLRAVPLATLQAAINTIPSIFSIRSVALPFSPRTDGVFLKHTVQHNIRRGKYAKVPIISGNTYDEGSILALGTLNITTERQLDAWLRDVWFPRTTAKQRATIRTFYSANVTKGSPFDSGTSGVLTPQNKRINAIVGDMVYQVARRYFIRATYKTQPTWSYISRVYKDLPLLGSFHASDVLSVFGLSTDDPATEMQTRWINFACTLNPNAANFIFWPTYGANSTLLQLSDTEPSVLVRDTFRQAAIAYWWSIVDYLAT